ncbi:hypothetical protein CF319_g9270 [Tilletia indica]|nr:hypothetical protein CF319_g9270 [Tilletia indica]
MWLLTRALFKQTIITFSLKLHMYPLNICIHPHASSAHTKNQLSHVQRAHRQPTKSQPRINKFNGQHHRDSESTPTLSRHRVFSG